MMVVAWPGQVVGMVGRVQRRQERVRRNTQWGRLCRKRPPSFRIDAAGDRFSTDCLHGVVSAAETECRLKCIVSFQAGRHFSMPWY